MTNKCLEDNEKAINFQQQLVAYDDEIRSHLFFALNEHLKV